jgi:hypothetical protein
MISFIAFVLALAALLKFTNGKMRIVLTTLLVLGAALIAIS